MHWQKWLGYNIYKKLWSVIGGRQWTFIMRDFAYQNPFLLLMIGFIIGSQVRPYLEWKDLIVGSSFFLLAHLFWGTKWKKGQGK